MNHTNPYASPTEPETQLVPAAPSVSFRGILNSGLRLYASRVEKWRGGLGGAYLFPALSFAGASLA